MLIQSPPTPISLSVSGPPRSRAIPPEGPRLSKSQTSWSRCEQECLSTIWASLPPPRRRRNVFELCLLTAAVSDAFEAILPSNCISATSIPTDRQVHTKRRLGKSARERVGVTRAVLWNSIIPSWSCSRRNLLGEKKQKALALMVRESSRPWLHSFGFLVHSSGIVLVLGLLPEIQPVSFTPPISRLYWQFTRLSLERRNPGTEYRF